MAERYAMAVKYFRVYVYDYKVSKNHDYMILKAWFGGGNKKTGRGKGLDIDILAPVLYNGQAYKIGNYTVTGAIFWTYTKSQGKEYQSCTIKPDYLVTPDGETLAITFNS